MHRLNRETLTMVLILGVAFHASEVRSAENEAAQDERAEITYYAVVKFRGVDAAFSYQIVKNGELKENLSKARKAFKELIATWRTKERAERGAKPTYPTQDVKARKLTREKAEALVKRLTEIAQKINRGSKEEKAKKTDQDELADQTITNDHDTDTSWGPSNHKKRIYTGSDGGLSVIRRPSPTTFSGPGCIRIGTGSP